MRMLEALHSSFLRFELAFCEFPFDRKLQHAAQYWVPFQIFSAELI
jgi:hypothetical protein